MRDDGEDVRAQNLRLALLGHVLRSSHKPGRAARAVVDHPASGVHDSLPSCRRNDPVFDAERPLIAERSPSRLLQSRPILGMDTLEKATR